MQTTEKASEALEGARAMLAADGYDLLVEGDAHQVVARIVPGSEACDECLVPRQVMEPMLQQMLADGGVEATLQLMYPDAHHDG